MKLRLAGLVDWSERSWWCLANCPRALDPHPPGAERLWSVRTGSPAAEVVTRAEAPPPLSLHSGSFVSPPPCPHSRRLESSQSHWIHSDFLHKVFHMTDAS